MLIFLLIMTSVAALQSDVIIVGLNAAYQKRFVLDPKGTNPDLVPGNVHRASEISEGVGGKGQDVAISLSCLGMTWNNVKLAQFIGVGGEGDSLLSCLNNRLGCNQRNSNQLTVRTRSRLRTCTTIVSADCSTELVEPSGEVAPDEISDMIMKVKALEKNAGAICFMGSIPPGCGINIYSDLAAQVVNGNTLTLIDSIVGLHPLLKTLSNSKRNQKKKGGGTVLKINVSELCKLANTSPKKETDSVTSTQIRDTVDKFLQEFEVAYEALDYIALTNGKYPAHLIDLTSNSAENAFEIFRIEVTDLSCASGGDKDPSMLYPIGAGDTVSAGLCCSWKFLNDRRQATETSISLDKRVASILQSRYETDQVSLVAQSFTFGLACATASCLQIENSMFDIDDAIKIYQNMKAPTKI